MERASRVQLQQHANGAQPSITGGVESRPSGSPGKPWRKIKPRPSGSGSTGPVQAVGPATVSVSYSTKALDKRIKKNGSQLSVGAKSDNSCRNQVTGSRQSIDSRSTRTKPFTTGSQLSLGPKVTRFQIDDLISDKQTNV